MSDIKRVIDIEVNTGAAQDAVGKLADEFAGMTKAGDESGDAMKRAARATAEATAKMQAAREAAQREARALAEVTAAASAHGKSSRQATEATARLRVAQDAAAKAHVEASQATAKAAHQISELAKTADKKAVVGLKRMSDQLQRVGKDAGRNASDLRTLEHRIASLGSTAQTTSKSTISLGSAAREGGSGISLMGALSKGAGALGLAALAGAAVSAAGALRDASAEVLSFSTATRNIPFGLDRARKATGGLVTDMQLAQSAAQGVALGVVKTEDEFASLAEAATKLGIKLGIGPSQALDNMMTALGRGSSEILDNLGVALKASEAYDRYAASLGKSADELTDAEKAVAFKTEAIRALQKAASETVVDLDSGAAAIQRVGVEAENAKMSLKGMVVEAAGSVVVAFEQMERAASTDRINERVEAERAHADAMRKLEAATLAQNAAQAEYLETLGKSTDLTAEERAAYEAVGKAAFDKAHTLGTLDGELLQHWTTVKDFTASLWGEVEAYAEATRAAKEHAEAQRTAKDALWERYEKHIAQEQDKAIWEAFLEENKIGPALPPGYKTPEKGKKSKKSKKDPRLAQHDFATDVEDFEFAITQDVRKQADAAAAEAYEQEKAVREARVAGIERELELLEAMGGAEAERIDAVFFAIDIEAEAAAARSALIDERIAEEERLARWELKNAQTAEQREKARTRLEGIEHKKRVTALQAAADAEAKEHARRLKVVETVTGAVMTLGEGMVSAIQAAAEGQKGAIAQMLADLLKTVATEHAILALAEAAKGVGASAMTWGIPNPKAIAHFSAAGMHTGVAVAAGVGSAVAGKVADVRSGGGGAGAGFRPSGGGGAGGSSASGSSDDEGLQAQRVPVSHESLRRADSSMNRGGAAGAGATIITGPVHLYGGGSEKEFGAFMDRTQRHRTRSGYRV
jgi:hypothetical protein